MPRSPDRGRLHCRSLDNPSTPEALLPQLRRLFREATDNTVVQLLRYTLVGGLAYLVDFTTLALLTEWAGFHYLTSAAIGFLLGLGVNYLLSVTWVFATRRLEDRLTEFLVFTSVGLVGLLLNQLFLWLFTEIAGFHYLISKLLATGFVYLWNFTVRKLLLFR